MGHAQLVACPKQIQFQHICFEWGGRHGIVDDEKLYRQCRLNGPHLAAHEHTIVQSTTRTTPNDCKE